MFSADFSGICMQFNHSSQMKGMGNLARYVCKGPFVLLSR